MKRKPRLKLEDLFHVLNAAEQWDASVIENLAGIKDYSEEVEETKARMKRYKAFRLAWMGETAAERAFKLSDLVDALTGEVVKKARV